MHSKEYMVEEFFIMFKYAATNLIITFMLIFYAGEAVLLIVCIDMSYYIICTVDSFSRNTIRGQNVVKRMGRYRKNRCF